MLAHHMQAELDNLLSSCPAHNPAVAQRLAERRQDRHTTPVSCNWVVADRSCSCCYQQEQLIPQLAAVVVAVAGYSNHIQVL